MKNRKTFLQTSLLCLLLAASTSYAAKNDDDDDPTEYLPYNEKSGKELMPVS